MSKPKLPDVWVRTLNGAIDWAEDCCYATEQEMREHEPGDQTWYPEDKGYGVARYVPESALATLRAELAEARRERDEMRHEAAQAHDVMDDTHETAMILGKLLERSINALRGDPPPRTRWSYHDIPDRIVTLAAERDVARRELAAAREDAEKWRALQAVKAGPPPDAPYPGDADGARYRQIRANHIRLLGGDGSALDERIDAQLAARTKENEEAVAAERGRG